MFANKTQTTKNPKPPHHSEVVAIVDMNLVYVLKIKVG